MPKPARRVLPGVSIAALGIALAKAMHLHPQALRVPSWVADMAALSFLIASVGMLLPWTRPATRVSRSEPPP